MSYNVEFTEPIFDSRSNQWILIGSLHLQVEGDSYRELKVKHWLSHEFRFNERKFEFAKESIRRDLRDRANRETRAVLQYRPSEPANFERIQLPTMRRIYPQLIAGNIVGVQPMGDGSLIRFLTRYRPPKSSEKVNWKQEGF